MNNKFIINIIMAFSLGLVFIPNGCNQKAENAPAASMQMNPSDTDQTQAQGSNLPAPVAPMGIFKTPSEENVTLVTPDTLFSGTGKFMTSSGGLVLEITPTTPGNVKLTAWINLDDSPGAPKVGNGTGSYSQKDLILCWDTTDRLWFYHPTAFVSFFSASSEEELYRSFVGSGANYLDEMPTAFKETIPANIDELYQNAVSNSPDGILPIP